MNISVYLYGSFRSGYSQYPDDYAKSIFDNFHHYSKATTQIAIHREGNLMYYGYIRKLEDKNYIGLCTVINGKYLTTIDSLFPVYEGIIEMMVKNGYLIHFNNQGEITTLVSKLHENAEEIGLITASLQNAFDGLIGKMNPLPPVNYGVGKDSVKNFSIQDELKDIVTSSYTNGYTYVYKSKEYDSASLKSYAATINRMNGQVEALKKQLNETNQQLTKEKLAKKRFKLVAILAIVVFIFFIFNINLYKDKQQLGENLSATQATLDTTQTNLDETKGKLKNKQNELTIKNEQLNSSREENAELKLVVSQKTDSLKKFKRKLQQYRENLEREQIKVSKLEISNRQLESDKRKLKEKLTNYVEVSEKDISLKLYDLDAEMLKYVNASSTWFIKKGRRDKELKYSIKIYYKGNLVSQQKIVIN